MPATESLAIPAALHAAIASAPDRTSKIQIAYDYLYLRGHEIGVTALGANGPLTPEHKLSLVRAAESALGIRLLPPEV